MTKKIILIVAGLVGLYLLFRLVSVFPRLTGSTPMLYTGSASLESVAPVSVNNKNTPILPGEVDKRLVIRDANISLVVNNLNESRDKIVNFAETNQGYLVSADVYGTEQNTRATVTVRVPEAKFTETLNFIRSQGLKVTSESISGQDVTEEYIDLTGRLKSLEASRIRFQEILKNASTVDQILQVQREIDRVQMEIEQTTGRMEYLKKSSAMSKITVNLALDEESLPYVAPSEKWKPIFIFKQAIRSLVVILKNLSYLVIWVAVFAVIWVPAVFLFKFLKKKFWNKLP